MRTLIILSIFTSVALLSAAILYPFLIRRTMLRDRLDKLMPQNEPAPLTMTTEKSAWKQFFEKFGKQIPLAGKEQSKYSQLLVAAGFRREALHIFLGTKVVLACGLPALYILLYALPHGIIKEPDSLMYIVGLASFGYLAPSLWLTRRVSNRKTEIFHTLPDVLDLMTICVEAGLGIDASMNRASENPQFRGNPLADELALAAREIRAGKPRAEALRDMAERTMEDDLRAFVTMLVQTEKFGTSLSLALRVHSDSLRTKRRQIAEELAAKTAIKILFPLILFVFPALMIVLIGPAFMKMAEMFK